MTDRWWHQRVLAREDVGLAERGRDGQRGLVDQRARHVTRHVTLAGAGAGGGAGAVGEGVIAHGAEALGQLLAHLGDRVLVFRRHLMDRLPDR